MADEQEKTVFDYLEYNDLNEGMKLIADELGFEAARKLIENYPNETIYIPQLRSLLRNAIKKHMTARLNTGKRVDLTHYKRRLGCSYRYLQYIVNEIYKERKKKNNKNNLES
jgi:hypothetical protein